MDIFLGSQHGVTKARTRVRLPPHCTHHPETYPHASPELPQRYNALYCSHGRLGRPNSPLTTHQQKVWLTHHTILFSQRRYTGRGIYVHNRTLRTQSRETIQKTCREMKEQRSYMVGGCPLHSVDWIVIQWRFAQTRVSTLVVVELRVLNVGFMLVEFLFCKK